MRKFFVVLFALLACMVMPLIAQEKKEMPAMPAPPAPLEDDFLNWMVGEWKGWTDSPMGKSEDWMRCEMGMGGQFLILEFKADGPMGRYVGGGAFTLNQEGGIEALWIDSFRDMAKGNGTREGDVMTMHWESKMGKGTRITTKVSNDKLAFTSTWEMPDGTKMESKSEMARVEAMTEKK